VITAAVEDAAVLKKALREGVFPWFIDSEKAADGKAMRATVADIAAIITRIVDQIQLL
jgi:hypothetical protein